MTNRYEEIFAREIKLIGEDNFDKITKTKVLVFGLGGVGGHCVDALVRAGISYIGIVDKDVVDISNINRQIIANMDTIGKCKVDVMEEHIKSINPGCNVIKYNMFFNKDNSNQINFNDYDYVIDCIDSVSSKVEIIRLAKEANKFIISSMGTGNKLNPSAFEIKDINQTEMCPLAKAVRLELRKLNIKDVKVLFSKEEPIKTDGSPASISFVPSSAGLLIASYVIKNIIK